MKYGWETVIGHWFLSGGFLVIGLVRLLSGETRRGVFTLTFALITFLIGGVLFRRLAKRD
jgi:hypothetical protein